MLVKATSGRQTVRIVILGCGRVGAMLASKMDKAGHQVSVIDQSRDSFQRLDPQFGGETIVGNGVDEDVLIRAGIKDADAFCAVTNGDNRNIMASQIAREIFKVKKVVCRIYDPIRQSTYQELGLEGICPTAIGVQMLYDAVLSDKAGSAASDRPNV
jgi:trk system potassium uptake protein TrkA